MSEIDSAIPTHVGLILDGNRRWAKQNNLPTLEGHRRGADRFKEIAVKIFDRGVSYISAYIFSTENWQRTDEEVGYLMKLVLRIVETELDEFHNRGVRIVVLGSRDKLSSAVLKAIDKTVEKTKNNKNGTIALCFNYGGLQEIADAAEAVVQAGETLSVESIGEHIYHPEVPQIDLLIRTSGEHRISGYMLWRSAYAELYFSEKMWPDFDEKCLDQALADYANRQRRFGA